MPIEALPLSTAKRIYSAQVIFDPFSVVKELLDNSLDACATSVSIEISPNTLDVIQARDNGHGIPHEDRTLVCVRHCTSKLSDISELHLVGGTWLGFRGQALSSLAEISGGLSITTRAKGEIAAEKLEIGKDGEITRFDPNRSEFRRGLQRLQGIVEKKSHIQWAPQCALPISSAICLCASTRLRSPQLGVSHALRSYYKPTHWPDRTFASH